MRLCRIDLCVATQLWGIMVNHIHHRTQRCDFSIQTASYPRRLLPPLFTPISILVLAGFTVGPALAAERSIRHFQWTSSSSEITMFEQLFPVAEDSDEHHTKVLRDWYDVGNEKHGVTLKGMTMRRCSDMRVCMLDFAAIIAQRQELINSATVFIEVNGTLKDDTERFLQASHGLPFATVFL
jgi:hypothetical protein